MREALRPGPIRSGHIQRGGQWHGAGRAVASSAACACHGRSVAQWRSALHRSLHEVEAAVELAFNRVRLRLVRHQDVQRPRVSLLVCPRRCSNVRGGARRVVIVGEGLLEHVAETHAHAHASAAADAQRRSRQLEGAHGASKQQCRRRAHPPSSGDQVLAVGGRAATISFGSQTLGPEFSENDPLSGPSSRYNACGPAFVLLDAGQAARPARDAVGQVRGERPAAAPGVGGGTPQSRHAAAGAIERAAAARRAAGRGGGVGAARRHAGRALDARAVARRAALDALCPHLPLAVALHAAGRALRHGRLRARPAARCGAPLR
eukprot:scaffold101595_cov63-Phaeocystis_antarctica.AAC.2